MISKSGPRLLCLVLLTCVLITPFVVDPYAYSGFRQPKLAVAIYLAGLGALLFGVFSMLRPSCWQHRWSTANWFPLVAVTGLSVIAGWHLFESWSEPRSLSFQGVPLRFLYQLDILIPVAAWFLLHFVAMQVFSSARSRRRLALCVVIAMALESILVTLEMIQLRTGLPTNPLTYLAEIKIGAQSFKHLVFGTIGNPNWVGGYLALGLPVALALFVVTRKPGYRIILALAALTGLTVMVATRSKAALLGLGVGVVFWLVLQWFRRVSLRWHSHPRLHPGRTGIALVVVLGILSLGILLADMTARPREGNYLSHWLELGQLRGDSVATRALLADCSLRMWQQDPLGGLGPGTFRTGFLEQLHEVSIGDTESRYRPRISRLHSLRAAHTHNEYLQVLVEWGALGLLLAELYLVWFLVVAQKATLQSGPAGTIAAGLLASCAVGLTLALFDMPFFRPAQSYLLAILSGALLASPTLPAVSGFSSKLMAVMVGIVVGGMGLVLVAVIPPQYIGLRRAQSVDLILQGEIQGGRFSTAREYLEVARRFAPGRGDYHYLAARLAARDGSDPNTVLREIRRTKLVSDQPDLYLLEAQAQIEKADYRAALESLNILNDLAEQWPGLQYWRGRVFEATGKDIEAETAYRDEVRWAATNTRFHYPQAADATLRVARLLHKRDAFEEAVRWYQDFLGLLGDRAPTYPAARLGLGRILRDVFHDYEGAIEQLTAALQILEANGSDREAHQVEQEVRRLNRMIHQSKSD